MIFIIFSRRFIQNRSIIREVSGYQNVSIEENENRKENTPMKNTAFDYKRIAEGYRNRPYLHPQVIRQFQRDTHTSHLLRGLDVGCGAGLSTRALKTICTWVTGTDISREMIRVAEEVCAGERGISFLVSSAEDFCPESADANCLPFDIATAVGAIQWIDRARFLSNMQRLLAEHAYLLLYDFAISDTMPGNPAYTDWWHQQYLTAFPRPYRNEAIWTNEDVAPFGFCMRAQNALNLEYSFDLDSFVRFMMIQSNVNTQIEENGHDEEQVRQWFLRTLSPIFSDEKQRCLFKGYSWYLQK